MSDTKSDSDDSIVFVGISKNIKVTADVHKQGGSHNAPDKPKEHKRRRILPTEGEPSVIPDSQGKYIQLSPFLLIITLKVYSNTNNRFKATFNTN